MYSDIMTIVKKVLPTSGLVTFCCCYIKYPRLRNASILYHLVRDYQCKILRLSSKSRQRLNLKASKFFILFDIRIADF